MHINVAKIRPSCGKDRKCCHNVGYVIVDLQAIDNVKGFIQVQSRIKQVASQMIKSGYDKRKRNVLRRCLNIASDGADVMCDGRLFQTLTLETGKACLPTLQRLKGKLVDGKRSESLT